MKLNETKSFLRIPVIYGILNTITSKWYIGSCVDLKDRMLRHRYYLRHNMHHSPKLLNSYNKYGEDSFEVNILQFLLPSDDRFSLEESYIKKYDSKDNGYNILDTCKHVDKFRFSEEARSNFIKYIKTLEKSVMAFNSETGEIIKTFESVSDAAKYFHTSSSNVSRVCNGEFKTMKRVVFIYTKDFDETKDYRTNARNKGIKFTEEHKKKMSMSNKRCKKVYKYDLNHNLIDEYYSRSEAERKNDMKREFLRCRLDRPINGYIYSHTKY